MKNAILILCLGLFALSSCRQNCDCYRTCSTFDNGTITVCNSAYTSYQYQSVVDSLNGIYHDRHDMTTDHLSVKGTETGGVVNQLEAQGYYCNCINPK